jgi:hypothetical protein
MIGTIVATLQQPIANYFGQSHKASYIGTSYLLSVCCFTPLYGSYSDLCRGFDKSKSSLGRFSDILGRKGAMVSIWPIGLLVYSMSNT